MFIDFAHLITLAHDNTNYRKVIDTFPYAQTVVMHLKEGEDIPTEIHPSTTQIIYVVDGLARILTPNHKVYLSSSQIDIIPPNTTHYVANASTEPLKLISIYLPKEHSNDRIDIRQPKQ